MATAIGSGSSSLNPATGPLGLLSKSSIKLLGSKFNEGASSGVSDFAKRQMAKMGWKGGGLGKAEDGIVEHVRVDKKEDNAGVGRQHH